MYIKNNILKNKNYFINIIYFLFLIILIIFLFIFFYIFNNNFGDIGISILFNYIFASFFSIIIYYFILFLILNNNKKYYIFIILNLLLFGLLKIFFLFKSYNFSTNNELDQFMYIVYNNWRIDVDFLKFEVNNNCIGLKKLNDPCLNCCDEIYYLKLKNFLNLIHILILIILIYQFINFSIFPLFEIFIRVYFFKIK